MAEKSEDRVLVLRREEDRGPDPVIGEDHVHDQVTGEGAGLGPEDVVW